MRFAVIGDIHSNLIALTSVINDIQEKNTDFILCTGDNVGYSPYPNEVIRLLRQNNVLSIQGNYDKAIGSRELLCGCDYTEQRLLDLAEMSVAFTNNAVSDKNREYLINLPKELRLHCESLNILVIHGSPRRINEALEEDSAELVEVLQNISEDVLIYGHTHRATYKKMGGKHAVNAGSVGKPVNGNPKASYVILEIVKRNVKVEIVEVAYDVERAAKAIENTETLPDEFADMLRYGGTQWMKMDGASHEKVIGKLE